MSTIVTKLLAIALLLTICRPDLFAQGNADDHSLGQFRRGDVIKQIGLRPPRQGGVYVVAHRGAHQGIPENSLPAYKRAIELGVDFVEIDIRMTKDGVPVSMHNNSVDAYAQNAHGRVEDMTFEELRKLDIGEKHGPKWRDTRVPTFAEILDLCRGKCGIYLDLKKSPVKPLIAMIRERGMERDVLWYAGLNTLEEVRQQCPKCIEMPDPGPPMLLEPMLKRMHPFIVASVWRFYSQDFVDTCHRAGALVIVDESDKNCWDQALAWGSDGIQTDFPADLIARLTKAHR
jgi:glycerophosphoryl diester phosphodiesterase